MARIEEQFEHEFEMMVQTFKNNMEPEQSSLIESMANHGLNFFFKFVQENLDQIIEQGGIRAMTVDEVLATTFMALKGRAHRVEEMHTLNLKNTKFITSELVLTQVRLEQALKSCHALNFDNATAAEAIKKYVEHIGDVEAKNTNLAGENEKLKNEVLGLTRELDAWAGSQRNGSV